METEAWIATIGLVVILGIALRYISSNSYSNTQKPKDWELLETERIAREKENRRRQWLMQNPPKIYPEKESA